MSTYAKNITILVKLVSSSFFLLLSPEFLGSLASFFVVPNPPEHQDEPIGVRTKRQQAISGKVAQTAATPSAPAPPSGTLTLNCRVHDIEVILIENSLQPETSQALILSFNCQLDAKNVSSALMFTCPTLIMEML